MLRYSALLVFIIFQIASCQDENVPPKEEEAAVDEEIPEGEISLDGGFSTNITWKTLEEGLDVCNKTKKPMMLLIHKTLCPACNTLKEIFCNSSLIQELSDFFVCVNLMDQEVPESEALAPDGHYFPRILFITHDSQVVHDITNPEAGKDFLYYYFTAKSVEVSMAKAIRFFYNISSDKGKEL